MKKPIILISLFVAASFLVSGCTLRHGDFTVISNKLTRLSEFELEKAERNKDVIGQDVLHYILFFPTSGPPSLEGALDDAFKKNHCR